MIASLMSILLWACIGFLSIETGGALIHKFLFHGPLWFIHSSHHRPKRGQILELNDLFAVAFSLLPIWLMMGSSSVETPRFAVGLGMTVHGAAYFILHDLMTHRRWWPLNPVGESARKIVRHHRVHHQRVDRAGQGPWGLLLPW